MLDLKVAKQADGSWTWVGAPSNNYRDDDAVREIISKDAHAKFAAMIESGEYEEVAGTDMPELWILHIPVPIGKAKHVAEVDGFLLATGSGFEGEFYDKVFSALEDYNDELFMSHGMIGSTIEREDTDKTIITAYVDREFTIGPEDVVANTGTPFMVGKSVAEKAESWLKNVLGEDLVADFLGRLKSAEEKMEGRESKSLGTAMNIIWTASDLDWIIYTLDDEGVDVSKLNEAVKLLAAAAIEQLGEVVGEENADKMIKSYKQKKEVDVSDSNDEVVDEIVEEVTEATETEAAENDASEVKYVTHEDLATVVGEIIDGVSGAVGEMVENKVKAAMSAELDTTVSKKIKEAISEAGLQDIVSKAVGKAAEDAANTPMASIAGLVNQRLKSATESDDTQLDYNKDRVEFNDGPEQAPVETGASIGLIDRQISGARSANGSV